MSRPRRVVVHIITGLNDGGAEAALFRLCTADHDARHLVVSLMGPGKYGPLLEKAGIAVLCLDMPQGKMRLAALWRLRKFLTETRPDAVQTWMYHADFLGGIAARTAGIRNLCWGIHNTTLTRGESASTTILISRLCAILSRFVPRAIVCCAEKSAEVHADLGYRASIMRVVNNGYDLSQFRPDDRSGQAVRAELGLGDEALIGFVARFDSQKDHRNLLGALRLLKSRGQTPRCLLVGTGMDAANGALTAMVDEFGLSDQLDLLGRRDDVPAIMNALDVHVLASLAEAFPNVLAEAMACGTPCVSTDVGDAAIILGDTGWIVPRGDPAAMADAISRALAERGSSSWQQRQQDARQRIETRFSIEQMVEGYRAAWFGEARESRL